MSGSVQKYVVPFLGTTYTLLSDEPEQELRHAITTVATAAERLATGARAPVDHAKVAVLVAVDLVHAQQHAEHQRVKRLQQLNQQIDHALALLCAD